MTLRLTGTWITGTSRPARGLVRIAWAHPYHADQYVLATQPELVDLDDTGSIDVTIPDRVGLDGAPLLRLEVLLQGALGQVYLYPVPEDATGTVDVADLTPVEDPGGWLVDLGSLGGGAPSSEAARLTRHAPAAAALSGHRVVTPNLDGSLRYASATVAGDVLAPLWLTLQAALVGASCHVLCSGAETEESWAWARGPVFLGANGVLTQTAPTAPAFAAVVGFATAPTSLLFDRQPSIIRA